jgi:hypothetical protein
VLVLVVAIVAVVLGILVAQGERAGIDSISIVSKLASIRGLVHVGQGSGQDMCIRSGWSG